MRRLHYTVRRFLKALSPSRSGLGFAFPLLLTAVIASGCGAPTSSGSSSSSAATAAAVPISWTHFEVGEAPAPNAEMLLRGGEVYADNCSACHGDNGDGAGLCSAFLAPAPRDFTTGVFRFKTTPGGQMPTDQDLFRTVSLGLHSTGMPPWKFLLTEEERWAVVQYVKGFSSSFERDGAGEPVDLGQEPEISAERIAAGRDLYVTARCSMCHGESGYGDGPSAATLIDAFGNAIPARNYHKTGHFKRGHTPRDIALAIHTGNNGTPMPAFDGAFTADEIWSMAFYVHSLGEAPLSGGGEPAAASAGGDLGQPDVVIKLIERSWKFVPDVITVTQGQVVRVDFQPTDNGLGVGHGFAIDGYDRVAFINGAMVQRPKSVTFLADKAGTFVFYCASQCSTGPLHPAMNGTLVVEPAGNN